MQGLATAASHHSSLRRSERNKEEGITPFNSFNF